MSILLDSSAFLVATLYIHLFITTYPSKRLGDVVDQIYDCIEVGGGTTRSAIASHLSETPDTTISVLERGSLQVGLPSMIPLASVVNNSYSIRPKLSLIHNAIVGRVKFLRPGNPVGIRR